MLAPRTIAFVALTGVALIVTGCSGNKDKIVGKWKLVSMTAKDGKEQKADFMGITPIMEFTADGNIKVGLDAASLPAELKGKMDKDATAKMSEMKQIGQYKISGDIIEFVGTEKKEGSENPFSKNNKGKLSIDGDNMTITGDDGTVKFSRLK